MAGRSVSGWDDPRWLDEAERIRVQFFAEAEAAGRIIRRKAKPELLRKRARDLDQIRYGGAADDDQKRELLRVAIRQTVDGVDREDLQVARPLLIGEIEDRLGALDLSREVRVRAGELLQRELAKLLSTSDHPGAAGAEAIGSAIADLVLPVAEGARFQVEVAAEIIRRVDAGLLDDDMAALLRSWSTRVTPLPDATAFVEECLAVEARRATAPLRSDLQEFLRQAWRVLEEAAETATRMARSSDARRRARGEAMLDAIPGVAGGIGTKATWLDRTGDMAPTDVNKYVGRALKNGTRDVQSARACDQDRPAWETLVWADDGIPIARPQPPPPPDVELELDELEAVLGMIRADLFGAGVGLAEILDARRRNLGPRQRAMFRDVFDVTTVTLCLVRADLDGATIRGSGILEGDESGHEPAIAVLRGLADLERGGSPAWLKLWTYRALGLVDDEWGAKYRGVEYGGTQTLAPKDWIRLHRITAGAAPEAYKDETARGGAVALIRAVLAPSIQVLHSMGARYRRGEMDEAR